MSSEVTPSMSHRRPNWVGKLGLLAVAFVVSFFAAGLLSKTYRSNMTLYFPQSASSGALATLGGGKSDEGGAIPSLGGAVVSPVIGSGPTLAQKIAMSRSSLDKVVKSLRLDEKWNVNSIKAREKLSESLSSEVDKNGTLKFLCTARDPQLATKILQEIQQALLARSQELTVNVSRKNRKFVEKELAKAQKDADELIEETKEIQAEGGGQNYSERLQAYFEVKKKVDTSQIMAASERARLAALTSGYSDSFRNKEGNPDVVGMSGVNSALADMAKSLQQRLVDLQDAMKFFQDDSPEVQTAKKRYDAAKHSADLLNQRASGSLGKGGSPLTLQTKAALDSEQASLNAAKALMRHYESILPEAAKQDVSFLDLKARLTASLDRRASLENELIRAKIAEERDPSRFEVIDEPETESDPIGPRRGLVALAFTSVVFLILTAGPLFNRVRQTFETPAP